MPLSDTMYSSSPIRSGDGLAGASDAFHATDARKPGSTWIARSDGRSYPVDRYTSPCPATGRGTTE